MAESKISITINNITYEGCSYASYNSDGNCYFAKTSSGEIITDETVLRNNWYTATRYISLTISKPADISDDEFLWYYTSGMTGGEDGIKDYIGQTVYLGYYQPGAKAPYALCGTNDHSNDKVDRGWVTEKLFKAMMPQGKIESTVTFNPNGGALRDESKKTKKVKSTEAYGDLPEVNQRDGYHFDGWYTKSSGGNIVTSNTIVTETENHTLYAHWTEYEITINYYRNGGNAKWQGSEKNTSPVASQTIKYSQTEDLYNYNNEDYLYITKYRHVAYPGLEWNTKNDGTGTGIKQSTEKTGQAWAELFGKSLKTSNASQSVYVNWVPDGLIRVYVKDQGWKLGVPYIYVKDTGWKEAYAYIYDSSFGTTDDWKPGR